MSEIGETYSALRQYRQEKRRATFGNNMARTKEIRTWCEQFGVKLEIKNDGQHWIFRWENRIAEYWPSSSKLVFDRQYKRSRGCPTVGVLIEQLRREVTA